MPPKKRRVAAKVREQRRRDARVAAEPIIELEGEHEEPSEAEDRELESYDENNARIDAEVDALRVKYGIHDDECSWPSTRMLDVEENTEKLTRSELLDAVIARSDAVMARSEELLREEECDLLRYAARRFAARARKRALGRPRGCMSVPSRRFFDLMRQ